MAVRASRLLSALAAGSVLTGSLVLGGGTALAQQTTPPATGQTVPARCGQTVTANPGDQIKVIPAVGLPFLATATDSGTVSKTVGLTLCRVTVNVVQPVTTRAVQAAPAPLEDTAKELTDTAESAVGAEKSAAPKAAAPTAEAAAPTPAPAAAPAPATAPMTPQQLAANAPLFAPAFSSLPSSFLSGAMAPTAPTAPAAPAGLPSYDPSTLFGSAFPGLRAGAPAYLGYDPASAVTTTSQVQALPVDGLADGGVGVPGLLAVLMLSGLAAYVVRRSVLGGRTATATAGGSTATGPNPTTDPASTGRAAMTAPAAPQETDAERTVDVPGHTEVTDPAAEAGAALPSMPVVTAEALAAHGGATPGDDSDHGHADDENLDDLEGTAVAPRPYLAYLGSGRA